MDLDTIMKELSGLGNEITKSTYQRHGVREPFFGVKVADLKVIQKRIKKNYELSLELYDTGNADAMYLAGLIADESKMTENDLKHWLKGAYYHGQVEYTVAWIAAESKFGYELGMEWIESDDELVAICGWSTLSSLVAVKPDEELDLKVISSLLDRVVETIHTSQNRVRYTMNGFIISVGSYVNTLTDKAKECAEKIGKVHVDMGGTACKVPLAKEYIAKVESKGRIGKKRKMARC